MDSEALRNSNCNASSLSDWGVDLYVPAILLRIERLRLLKIIATVADDR